MVDGTDGAVLRQVGRLLRGEGVAGLSDGQLLERFATRGDEGAEVAFEAILRRHGPMVLGVCRRVLRDPHAAEDAFQATFLVLARKAGSVRVESSLGHWLYGVTYRIAVRARVQADRRRAREGGDPALLEAPGADDTDRRDLDAAIQEEVARLPEKYRKPIVLCYFEGKTHEAAAESLHWPVGTVRGRLARARDLLRRRLSRRGLAPSAGAIGAYLLPRGATAGVPGPLFENTLAAAVRVAAGRSVAAGLVSATAAALSEGALRTMTLAKLKWALAGVVALGIAGGAGARAYQGHGPGRGPGPMPIQLAQAKGEERKADQPRPAESPKVEEAKPAEALPAPSPARAEDPPTLPGPKPAEAPSLPPMPEAPKAAEPPPASAPSQELPSVMAAEPGPAGAMPDQLPSTPNPEPEPPDLGQASQNLINVRNGLIKRVQVLEAQSKDLRLQADKADAELKSARSMLDAIERVIQPVDIEVEAHREPDLKRVGRYTQTNAAPAPRRTGPPPEAENPESPRVVKAGDVLRIVYPSEPHGQPTTAVERVDRDGRVKLGEEWLFVTGLTADDVKERVVNLLLFKKGMPEEQLGLIVNRGKLGGTRVRPRDTKSVSVSFFVDAREGDTELRIKALEEKLDRLIDELKAVKPAAGADRRPGALMDQKGNLLLCTVEGDVERPGQYPATGKERVSDVLTLAGCAPRVPESGSVRLIRPNPVDGSNPKRTFMEFPPIDLDEILRGHHEQDLELQPGDRLIVKRDNRLGPASQEVAPELRDPAPPSDVEHRLKDVEQKLDRLLKALEAKDAPPKEDPKPTDGPKTSALHSFLDLLLGPAVPVPLPHYAAQPQRRVEQLLVDSENLRAAGDWNRFWFLDQPSALTPSPTHGGNDQ